MTNLNTGEIRKRVQDRATYNIVQLEKDIIQALDEIDRLREVLINAKYALQGAKKLTQGPSFELQDSIMCTLLEALRRIKAIEQAGVT